MVEEILAKRILNKHKKRDAWFLDDYSFNPYTSCDFGCVYCYIHGGRYGRRRLAVKINAPQLLRKELSKRALRGQYGIIALSSATEPWMRIEEQYRITRKCLEVIAEKRFPVHCLTKSTLILRDTDILMTINENAILPEDLKILRHGILITFSFSTLDDDIAKIFEPFAPSPSKRIEAIHRLKSEGFLVGMGFIPILPYISDSIDQMENMAKTAHDLEVDYVFFGTLTLDDVGKEIFFRIIQKHFPEKLTKYRKLYAGRNTPRREYTSWLYRRAMSLCKKYQLRFGIIENLHTKHFY